MKKVITVLLIMLLTAGIVGCGADETKQAEAPSLDPNASSISQEALKDNELLKCAGEVFQEINIDTNASSFIVVRDDETSGVRNVSIEIDYDGINMTLACLSVDGKWSAVSIFDSDLKRYYWIADSSQKYGDIYDWKTGELISAKSEELPDTIPEESSGQSETLFSSVINYDDENSCKMLTTSDGQTLGTIGVCQFDGLDLETEALRALAFTTYCSQNAALFSDGNLSMLYYSGDDDGFASYVNGEIVLYDFPDGWNDYALEITQEQIKDELQNIVDNIKSE